MHDAREPDQSRKFSLMMWRTGGSVGRTVYVVARNGGTGHARDDDAVLIGMFDTAELAEAAVDAHNREVLGGHSSGDG